MTEIQTKMDTLSATPSKSELFDFISYSSDFGNLGLFIGSGFSKSVLNNEFKYIALSWDELLKKGAEKFEIEYSEIKKDGISYPDIATKICEEIAEIKNIKYQEAVSRFKVEISDLTGWYPEKESREEYSDYLTNLAASWIITTNYDLVLEILLTGKSVPFSPQESMCAPKDLTPIYHLHGIRSNPDSIVITQEDYVSLFRPNEYRQIKLALTIKESTVLLLGYGLGDINVLTALDWSNNVFGTKEENYPNEIIQIVKTDEPEDEPYRDKNKIVIYEVGQLQDFFVDYSKSNSIYKAKKEKADKLLSDLQEKLNPDEVLIDKFIDDQEYRKDILKRLANFPPLIISSFESFLNKVFDKTWERSLPNGAFEGYNENLIVQLDILTTLKREQIPPSLLGTLAYQLNGIGSYVGRDYGQSFSANDTFNSRKNELPEEIISELSNIARQHRYSRLSSLLDRISI